MKAVFLDRGSFPKHIKIELPNSIDDVVFYDNTAAENVIERIQDADIVLSNKVVLNEEAIHRANNLKLIQVMATGTNNVNINACQERNVCVQNVTDYSTISVPEHTFAMLLALRRNLTSYVDAVKSKRWADSEHFCFLDYPIKDLSGSTMTIIGGGTLGKKVAHIAHAFGMDVIFAERKNATEVRDGYLSFQQAIQSADIISINCPLTDETKDLISEVEFSLMKQSCLLLNISRGGIVDEKALVDALKNLKISGAAFDVATQEPMPEDHPLQSLTELPNFLLTPHIAWASDEAMQTLVNLAMKKITAFIDSSL
ncbi:MAG: D-2-hydroxyacid dehydrogenase [Marinomonas sp.]